MSVTIYNGTSFAPSTLVNVERFLNETYQVVRNTYALQHIANSTYENFQNNTGSLGNAVKIQTQYRMVATTGTLSATTSNSIVQRFVELVVNQKAYVRWDVLNLEDLFNDLSMNGKQIDLLRDAAANELATQVELNLGQEIINATYRAYKFGSSITYTDFQKSFDYAQAYGSIPGKMKVVFPARVSSLIIGNGLGQFTPKRNDRDVNTWQVGSDGRIDFFSSTLLPTHISGVAGRNQDLLTFSAIDGTKTILTLSSSAANTVGYLNAGDILTFATTASGGIYLNPVTYSGYAPTTLPVQVQVVSTADLVGGLITVVVYPALINTVGDQDRYISRALTVADTCLAADSHVCGLLMTGEGFYTAFPKLPPMFPFMSAVKQDSNTGVSMRFRYGAPEFEEPSTSAVIDMLFDKIGVPHQLTRLMFPLSMINGLNPFTFDLTQAEIAHFARLESRPDKDNLLNTIGKK